MSLGAQPNKRALPQESAKWMDLEKEVFQQTQGKYIPEVMAQLRSAPSAERVPVVFPTSEERREFHTQFCACFQAQDWPDNELIVIESYHRFPSMAVNAMVRRFLGMSSM